MSQHVLDITFVAHDEGSRKKPFEVFGGPSYCEVKGLTRLKDTFYKVSISCTHHADDVLADLREVGVEVVKIVTEGGHVCYRRRGYL